MTRRELLACFAAPMLNLGRCRLYAGTGGVYSTRAIDLVGRALVIDMLGLITLDWKKLAGWHKNPQTFSGSDIERLRDSGIDVFHPAVDLNHSEPHGAAAKWLTDWNRLLTAHTDDFLPVLGCAEIGSARQQNKIGVLLGMQNSDHFRNPDDVDQFYSLGQRVSQLTYNARNRLGYGCIERNDSGLTELGFQIIERMNKAGMIIDVSHAGDHTCLDSFAASTKPVLITHSNCRALVPHPRCKSDDVIRGMAKTGGVMGITGIRAFASRRSEPTVEDVLQHFDHVVHLAGIEHAGIGSDTDLGGVRSSVDVPGLNHARRIFELTDGLLNRGYTERHVELILGANFKRAMSEIFCQPSGATTLS